MKLIPKISLIVIALFLIAMKGDNPAYMLYKADGKKSSFKNLVKETSEADIVLFGEQHNNPIAHWLQLELTRELYDVKQKDLVLGAEMFESDDQLLLDEYLGGKIAAKNFEAEAKIWKNYKTDYKPLVEFAIDHGLDFIGTNIPRRYASLVHKKGFEGLDSLSSAAKELIPPLPVKYDPELKGYKSMMEEMKGMGGGHVNSNLPKAQAIKDATMAHFILKNWKKGKLFLHYNGTYHSENYEGIMWYLMQENPDLKIVTISTVDQDTITSLKDEFKDVADFILCVPADMTKTYSVK